VTLAANCFLVAGLAFLAFMAWQAWKTTRWRPEPRPLDRENVAAGAGRASGDRDALAEVPLP
jgi:threonine/homoserine/homoserine lactone efflux protein